MLGIAAVVILHAFLFYAINTGLAKKFVKIVKGPVEAKLIEEAKPDLPPPPPPRRHRQKKMCPLLLRLLLYRLLKYKLVRQQQ